MKFVWYFFLIVIASVAIELIFFPINVADKMMQTATDSVNKTINADNAIYNYEWFKQKYEDIQATKIQIDNTKLSLDQYKEDLWDRKNWTFEDKNEYARLNTIHIGQKNYLEWLIADYNARTKMANRNIFQNSILPWFIDSATFIIK